MELIIESQTKFVERVSTSVAVNNKCSRTTLGFFVYHHDQWMFRPSMFAKMKFSAECLRELAAVLEGKNK